MITYIILLIIISAVCLYKFRRKKTFLEVNNQNKWILLSLTND